MSQQGPILIASNGGLPSFAAALDEAKLFPVVGTEWADTARAIAQVQPAAVIAAASDTDEAGLGELAQLVASRQPYLPLIAVDPSMAVPQNVIPFFHASSLPDRLLLRLNAALRVRALHSSLMRRQAASPPATMLDINPVRDATVLLIGRGGAYPALSVALGERCGLVGALSIEAAAQHLNSRDIDGIVLADGFACGSSMPSSPC
jgi:hypothetical protein